MCGIAGLSAPSPVNPSALKAAAQAIAHRGPDDSGTFISPTGTTGLAHRRLSILDLSSAGHQPMSDAPGRLTIAYNGEIYNFRQLRSDLAAKGHVFHTDTDTEVILAGYSEWGEQVVERLNGIFAFAIHDRREDQVFLAVDHLGIKPLYICRQNGAFAFASELKALLKLVPLDRALDHEAIARYVTFQFCPGDQTPFKAVRRLPGATAMIVRNGEELRRWRYYAPPAYSPRRDWSPSVCAGELAETLRACVERQMVSDAPLGAFLSGGLDSSAVVAAARRVDPAIQCFTIRMEGGAEDGSADDLPYAREVAAHLQVGLHEVPISSELMAGHVEQMVFALDEPIADPACLNVFFISQVAASQGIKVLLSGTGGDDLFTGYRRHQALAAERWLGLVPRTLSRALASGAARGEGRSAARRKAARFFRTLAAAPEERLFAGYAWTDPSTTVGLFAADVRAGISESAILRPLVQAQSALPPMPPLEQSLRLDQLFFLSSHNLIYTDKMSMLAGIEARVPLLDPEMLDFAAHIPVEWKLRRLKAKWLFKESQRGILPDHVIDRPKSGFGAPLRRWLRKEMHDLMHDLLGRDTLLRRGLFDPVAVHQLMARNAAGATDGAYTLFSLMCIELWCRRFVDPAGEMSRLAAE